MWHFRTRRTPLFHPCAVPYSNLPMMATTPRWMAITSTSQSRNNIPSKASPVAYRKKDRRPCVLPCYTDDLCALAFTQTAIYTGDVAGHYMPGTSVPHCRTAQAVVFSSIAMLDVPGVEVSKNNGIQKEGKLPAELRWRSSASLWRQCQPLPSRSRACCVDHPLLHSISL